ALRLCEEVLEIRARAPVVVAAALPLLRDADLALDEVRERVAAVGHLDRRRVLGVVVLDLAELVVADLEALERGSLREELRAQVGLDELHGLLGVAPANEIGVALLRVLQRVAVAERIARRDAA